VKTVPTDIAGAYVIDAEPHDDPRGTFTRLYCRESFDALDLDIDPAQTSLSFNPIRGTLRGLHFQLPPHEETKLVSCVAGSLFDVVVDLRKESPTYGRWTAITLDAAGGRSLFVPKGCAHGFQTLVANTAILYHISAPYSPEASRGIRWDDPALAIPWPLPLSEMSARDQQLPTIADDGQSGSRI
jgi:dTDP-4-dehydrorhamnose 3,5-epimerase